MNSSEEFVSLHRYFILANRMRALYQDLFPLPANWTTNPTPRHSLHGDLGIFMSFWYAALYPVIEGYRALSLVDPAIDSLLASPNVDLLRRFRNTVFHYQRDYYDDRYVEFLSGGLERVEWIHNLNREFGRFFLEHLPR